MNTIIDQRAAIRTAVETKPSQGGDAVLTLSSGIVLTTRDVRELAEALYPKIKSLNAWGH